jgi:hypothetical protein
MLNTDVLSSSPGKHSGDIKLSIVQKLRWFYDCYCNNLEPLHDVDPRVEMLNFDASPFQHTARLEAWETPPVAPARFLSNAFWSQLDLSELCASPIRALEVGCGSGIYGHVLKNKLGEKLVSYKGVDISKHADWTEMQKANPFEFFVDRAENIQQYLPGINLIVTQSAIEHFEHDLVFFRHIADYVYHAKEPVWQIHLMPSPACLRTYLLHGYRQYTPRTISKITRLFPAKNTFALYRMGGARTNRVHSVYITLPALFLGVDFRKTMPKKYVNATMRAMRADQHQAPQSEAAFYALVIKSLPM